MSRSKRHTPIFGHSAKASSEKSYKSRAHRAERRTVRVALRADAEVPHPLSFGNPWGGPKDGRSYWSDHEAKDMRK